MVTHMDTNAEEKMINLRKKRELLLDKAKKYTQSMIHEKDDWYDSLLDDLVINHAVTQNEKISKFLHLPNHHKIALYFLRS